MCSCGSRFPFQPQQALPAVSDLRQGFTIVIYNWFFLHLSKALEQLTTILFEKLQHDGIRGITLECFKSYLSNTERLFNIMASVLKK